MELFATPGICRQTLEPGYRPGPLARGDIAVFPGYATRGPVGVPVRLQSLSQFEDVFGPALSGGCLWDGIKGFFETGGIAAYAIRLADGSERAAVADLALPPQDPGDGQELADIRWQARASFPWAMADPRRVNPGTRPDMAIWQARVDAEIRNGGARRDDPGQWGNMLSLGIAPAAAVMSRVEEVLEDGSALRLTSLDGVGIGTVLHLGGSGAEYIAEVREVLPALRIIRLKTPLSPVPQVPPASAASPLRASQIAFDLTVYEAGRVAQTFRGLSPNPAHPRAIGTVFTAASRHIALSGPGSDADWTDSRNWPPEGVFALDGGQDGLSGIRAGHWREALALIATLGDAAMIAAPDLVLAPPLPVAEDEIPGLDRPCSDISPQAPAYLSGDVVDGESGAGLALALVDIAGPGGSVLTDDFGRFSLTGVAAGLLELRISKAGFQTLEMIAQSTPWPDMARSRAVLTPVIHLPALPEEDILSLQRDMANPALVGPWKIAFADPLRADADSGTLRATAARLGPEPRLALLAPWIEVPDPKAEGGRRAVPPSGHVAGAFARAELQSGIFRTGANLPLRYACGTSVTFDDADQAGLNPVGVNLIRAFPGRGVRLHGTRSLAIGSEWQFLTARRIVDAIAKTLDATLSRLVFEPNSAFLRHAARAATEAFLARLWREGHLAGESPEAAFRVTSDEGNNPEALTDGGQLLIEVAVAPVVPFEFIIFRIGHAFDALQITEVG